MKYQFTKFVVVGVASTCVHSTIYLLFLWLASTTPQLANMLGFVCAFIVSYLGQRYWTFQNIRIGNERKSKIKFICSAFLSYGLNSFFIWLIEQKLELNPEYALFGIVLITPLLAFLVFKLWVFRDESFAT
ncbi:MAG: GtrA family protein [Deltaproteobacteria bacterium]|nr:GtrA family protein [Deltaproteobacteria bacterium]